MNMLKSSIVILILLLSSFVFAEEWSFMGIGPCRALDGSSPKPIEVRRNISWNNCRQRCEENQNCQGVEYNLRTDRSICELHGNWVTAGRTNTDDRVLSCWANDFPLPTGYSFPRRAWALGQIPGTNRDQYYCCTDNGCQKVDLLAVCVDSVKWGCTEGTQSCWPE